MISSCLARLMDRQSELLIVLMCILTVQRLVFVYVTGKGGLLRSIDNAFKI